MIDYVAIIGTILGSAGLFGFIQFLISRRDRKKNSLHGIERELSSIKKTLTDLNIRVTRMELIRLINEDSENVDTILQVAEYYFIDLDGNAYAHAIFEKWAIEHNVATGWLPKITKGGRYA